MNDKECGYIAEYCGEKLVCKSRYKCKGSYHHSRSIRYGVILWNDEKRPQPQDMFFGLGPGHTHGSREADAHVYAAAMAQDAANRMEYAQTQTRPTEPTRSSKPKEYWQCQT